jgi:replicative DNA helicase
MLLEKTPPQDLEAERAVLGSLLLSKDALERAAERLTADDFYKEGHQIIFGAMQDLFRAREPVDLVTVASKIRDLGKLDEPEVGGVTYLTHLANVVPTAANAGHYIQMVEEKAHLRKLIHAATEVAQMSYEQKDDIDQILDRAQQKILDVAADRTSGEFSEVKHILGETFENINKLAAAGGAVTGLSSGFRDLDKMTAGLQKSDLILIAARPSMGKTAFVLNIARAVAAPVKDDPEAGKSVAIFSLEMSKQQLVQRLLCAESWVDAQRLRTGQLRNQDWDNLKVGISRLERTKIFIDDTPGITVGELRSKARRLKMEKDLDLIVIDYLQLMSGNSGKGGDNRQQEISEISRSLKILARDLQVPVIALSQLSRGVEARQSKKPMLSDLRESGSLEQDADIVMFLYRDDYYNEDSEEPGLAELIIAKHRNGPVGSIKLFFKKEYTRFTDLDKTYLES